VKAGWSRCECGHYAHSIGATTLSAPPAHASVAVVTGAASGIGAAISTGLRTRGWRVAGIDLRAAESVELSLIVDVADQDAVATAMSRAEQQLGPLEALVTAAGYYEMVDIADIAPEVWARMLQVHLGGVVNTIRCALPGMVERRRGAIVAISSELAIGGGGGDAHYAAAKGAIIGLIKSLGVEVAEYGVRVNSVAPGPTDSNARFGFPVAGAGLSRNSTAAQAGAPRRGGCGGSLSHRRGHLLRRRDHVAQFRRGDLRWRYRIAR
jgi:NAD(P)-dependent dehydrogenase (short-subunit alcohol dehydrogenase family)